jgi:branched-chain amino acid transport system permease protein
MVYGIINLINFAHGEVLMVGALTSWTVIGLLQPACPALPGWVMLIMAADRLRGGGGAQLRDREGGLPAAAQQPALAPLITAIGMSPAAADAGHDHLEAQLQALSHLLPSDAVQVGGAVITPTQIMILGLTAVIAGALMYLVNYTKLGRAMRATAENPRVAG